MMIPILLLERNIPKMGKVKKGGNTNINIINIGNGNTLNGAQGLNGQNGCGPCGGPRGPRGLVARLKAALQRALGGQNGCCQQGGCCRMSNPGFGGGGCCNNNFGGPGLQFGMNVRGFLGF